jgi:uncharacterized HAD superfamily protein
MIDKDSQIIGLDLDGVLADIAPEFLKYVKKEFGLNFCLDDIRSYDATEWSGLNSEQVGHIFSTTDIFTTVEPVPCSIQATKILRKAGWKIHIITFRPWYSKVKSITLEWLENHGFFYDTLHMSEGHDKTKFVPEHCIKVFVEDRRESAELMSRLCERVYLLDYPYNQGQIRDNIRRVRYWAEIITDLGLSQNHVGEVL